MEWKTAIKEAKEKLNTELDMQEKAFDDALASGNIQDLNQSVDRLEILYMSTGLKFEKIRHHAYDVLLGKMVQESGISRAEDSYWDWDSNRHKLVLLKDEDVRIGSADFYESTYRLETRLKWEALAKLEERIRLAEKDVTRHENRIKETKIRLQMEEDEGKRASLDETLIREQRFLVNSNRALDTTKEKLANRSQLEAQLKQSEERAKEIALKYGFILTNK